ncbi:hypothetical protein KVH71_000926, partial [Campylobacter lari]|nr:hypothetical protein [Campylobacter lari]
PSFEGQANTIEYNKDFSIKVSGLLPNSTIDKISGSKGVKAKKDSYDVNDKGEATIEFEGVSDNSIPSIKINFNYIKKGIEKAPYDINEIKITPYDLSLTFDDFLNPYNGKDVNLEISKGLQNRKLIWSISGDGEFKNTPPEYFNSTDKIKVQITPKKPYDKSVKVSIKYEGESKDFSQIIRYDYKPEISDTKVSFFYKTTLKIMGLKPKSTIVVTPDKTLTYTKLESIGNKINVDENGVAYLNFLPIGEVSSINYNNRWFWLKVQYDRGDGKISTYETPWLEVVTEFYGQYNSFYYDQRLYPNRILMEIDIYGIPGNSIQFSTNLDEFSDMEDIKEERNDVSFDKTGVAVYQKSVNWLCKGGENSKLHYKILLNGKVKEGILNVNCHGGDNKHWYSWDD